VQFESTDKTEEGNNKPLLYTQDEEKHNAICVGHHYAQKNTNNVN
jgi:hypothetical protein